MGEKDLGGKAQQGKVGKDLRKEKGEALRGGKGLRGERGKRISAGKGGGGKILGRKGRRSGDKGLRGEGEK